MNPEPEKYDIDLLTRYVLGEASAEEIKQVDAWAKESPDNQKLLEELLQLSDRTAFNAEPAKVDTGKAWSKLKSRMDQQGKGKVIKMEPVPASTGYRILFRIAAAIIGVFLIAAIVFRFYQSNIDQVQFAEVKSGTEKLVQTLPDGSTVTLNQNSSLKYPTTFAENERRVVLTGEAFFDIEKDSLHPFIIEAGEAEIKVLGTSFNVLAYPERENIEVIVETGVVQLSGRNQPKVIKLTAGNKGIFSKATSQLSLLENDEVGYAFWRIKKLEFRNTSLDGVVKALNEYYHADLSFENESIRDCQFTATFQDDSLNTILDILTTTFHLGIEEGDSGKILTGTGCGNETL